MISKEANKKKHQKPKNEMKKGLFVRSSFAFGNELRKFGRSQRRFFAPLKDIK